MTRHIRLPSSRQSLYLTAGAASVATFLLLKTLVQTSRGHSSVIIPSPRKALLPKLSTAKQNNLPYPPDVLPDARDVETPYGTIRVYEWGPDDGRKVLLVHGISTPCIALAGVASKLVEKGCRVMLFDLFGRGYSDAPTDLPYDTRLYTTQILLALASSPLSWTGHNSTFALIGYSLGGGISAAFTSYFPTLVSSLILIAPSGLVRPSHITWKSKLLYSSSGLLPQRLTHWLVRRRLEGGPSGAVVVSPTAPQKSQESVDAEAPLTAEVGGKSLSEQQPAPTGPSSFDAAPLFPARPLITVASAVRWQLAHHLGFIPAFISSIQHAPIVGQHAVWARIGARLSAQKARSADAEAARMGLERGKVLVVLGRTDPVVLREEVSLDAAEALGEGNVEVVVLEAGHEVPISRSGEVVRAVWRFWGEDGEEEEGERVEVDGGT